MNKKILPMFLAIALLASIIYKPASAASSDIYVSPTGNDANACTSSAPCKTIRRGVNVVQPGGVLHLLAGTYSESVSFSKVGTQAQPIRIVGEGAVLSNGGQIAFNVSNSQWISFEGLTIRGYTLNNFEVTNSHYLTFKNNSFEYTFAAVMIKNGVSHVLVENNEMYQTYPAGSTWSSLKGSKYEGGGVFASSGGQGMYIIRGNNFHDSMNGIYLSDDDSGQWMNANIFISGNTFRNIVDDPFEPEGDSFNIHFYNNTLINAHRMASIVPNSACVGPIFVYGNYLQNTMDPTGEARTGRINSVIKMDMSSGTCPNGVWVFNNTANANVSGTNFYGVDLLTSSIRNYRMLNNVLVTEKNAYSGTPSFTNSLSDYNISLKPFGYTEAHSLQADPLLASNGTLQSNSPAKGRGTAVDIANYFVAGNLVPTGADLGAFRSFPAPKYNLPPGGEPASFPANVQGWPDALVSASPTPSLAPTLIPTQVSTQVPTQVTTVASPVFTATSIPSTPVPTNTPQSSGPFVSTELNPTSLTVGGTTLASVRLNNVPVEGYKSAEFACTYNVNLVQISNIVPANLFGADAVVAVQDPQNGSFIFAIAGTNGNKAMASGSVFTFNAKGLQAGQSAIECKARISKGDNVPIDLPFTGAGLTALGVEPTSTTMPIASPTLTSTAMPISSPTPAFTFTPLPSPDGSLTGRVISSKPVTVSLVNANNVIVASGVANSDGIFNLTALAGNYSVVAGASGFLSHQGSAIITAGNTTTKPIVGLLAGDIDGNNAIDQFDALTIGMSYNTAMPAAADLNNDSMINFLDLELLADNYRKTGPTAWE